MTDANTICRRCGFSNIPGDQFCGSCGAFLEWEGQPTGPSADAGTPVAPAPESPVAPVQTTWSPGPSAGVAPAAPVAAASSDSSLDLIRCPACGIANAAGRTFCQSCGATLAAASRVEELPHDVVAAAVAAVPTAPPASPASIRQAKPAGSGRRIPAWILVVGALGLVVGVVLVIGSTVLKGSNPGSGASAAPGASGVASSGEPGGPSGAASPVAAASVKLSPTGATASSVILDLAKFQPGKAIDGDRTTSWQEGGSREKDQWIEVAFAPSRADAVVIRNGYQASNALYRSNRRLKDVLVSVGGATPIATRLKDTQKAQTIDLGGVPGATSVRITIVSTYPGEKTAVEGSPFDDAAVSEIAVMGVPGG